MEMGESETLLSAKEIERYHRQIIIPEIGEAAQKRLKKATSAGIRSAKIRESINLFYSVSSMGEAARWKPLINSVTI